MKKRYKAALFLPAAAAAYFLAAWTLSSFRVNDRQSGGEITLFLVSNGTHVDVVMPLKNNVFDWTQTVSPADSGLGGSGTEYIGLGWGERNFYLNTPSWGDLTVPTARPERLQPNPDSRHLLPVRTRRKRKHRQILRLSRTIPAAGRSVARRLPAAKRPRGGRRRRALPLERRIL